MKYIIADISADDILWKFSPVHLPAADHHIISLMWCNQTYMNPNYLHFPQSMFSFYAWT